MTWKRAAQWVVVRALIRPLVLWRRCVVIAVTGTCGKTTTTLLLDRIYREAGFHVATCCTEGVFRDGVKSYTGDSSSAFGIWRALRGFRPDVLIAETARGGLIKWGAGYLRCDAAAVTCVGEDHIGMDGVETVEQMARVKSRVAASVRADGVVALNADEPLVRAMSKISPVEPTWVSPSGHPPAGRSIFPRDGKLWRHDDEGEHAIADLEEIALLDHGARAYNLTAVSLAAGIARGLQKKLPVSDGSLRETLKSFGRNRGDVPCRNELIPWKGDWILLCSATHAAAAKQDALLITTLRRRHGIRSVIVSLTGFADRGRDRLRAYAAVVAGVADFVWVRESLHPPRAEGVDLTAALCDGLGSVRHVVDKGEDFEKLVEALPESLPGPRLYVITMARYQPGFDVERYRAGSPETGWVRS